MPTQNSAMWGQKSNRKLIIGIFGFCLGLFGILCGMFWVDLFDWIMHKVIPVIDRGSVKFISLHSSVSPASCIRLVAKANWEPKEKQPPLNWCESKIEENSLRFSINTNCGFCSSTGNSSGPRHTCLWKLEESANWSQSGHLPVQLDESGGFRQPFHEAHSGAGGSLSFYRATR